MKGEWLRKPTAITTVVFVHGVLSSSEACWRHENGAYWPELLKDEPELAALGIYNFTYPTTFFTGNYDLSRVVDDLKTHLSLDGVLQSQHIIFVCHSMGGIVVRKYIVERILDLLNHQTNLGLFLVASPSLGSKYAELLKPLAERLGHAQADALRFAENNRWLNGLDKEFKNLLGRENFSIIIKGKELSEQNFIELVKLPILKWAWRLLTFRREQLVPPISGERYFPEPKMISGSDHSSIAKPANKEAEQHRLLCQFIKDNLLRTPSLQNSPPVTSFSDSTLKSQELHDNFPNTSTQSGDGNIALQHIKDSNITINLNQGAATSGSSTPAQRAFELAYLDYLEAEKLRNTERYTPMAGASQQKVVQPQMDMVFELTPVGKDRERLEQPRRFDDAVGEILQLRQVVLLGKPGGGKTTTIRKLVQQLVKNARQDSLAPIPLLIRLGDWISANQSLADFISSQVGKLGMYRDSLLEQNRAALLLDGLNELPVGQRVAKYQQVRDFITQYKNQHRDLIAVVSCREEDYKDDDLGYNRIVITPLDPIRIRKFIENYLPDEKGSQLFWKLAGEKAQAKCTDFSEKFHGQITEPEKVFWNASHLPDGFFWGWFDNNNSYWNQWCALRDEPSSLLVLARNPYMLRMLVSVYFHRGELPKNRGDLFREFVTELFQRELNSAKELERTDLQKAQKELLPKLMLLAEKMQNLRGINSEGNASTSLPKGETQKILDEEQLRLASSASILNVSDPVRFSHQLLQEYFAAKYMDIEFQAGRLQAEKLWQPDNWWERNNWEEAAILLAGLYSDDCTPIVTWLADANPEIAAQCIVRSGSNIAPATLEELRQQWLPRLTDLTRDPEAKARAAVGRALGMTGLDNRQGIGVINGLPDIDWVEIPGGEFQYGDENESDNPPQELTLSTFHISLYPITAVQFQAFLDDPEGYADPRWFEGLGADDNDRQMEEQYFKFDNHPRETVNWYQAMAFCRWLSSQMGGGYDLKKINEWKVRLPTEFEWEKAARGTDGRIYPYEGDYDPSKANTNDTNINQTSAVGIFSNGASPYGVMDMSGNVWEWCLSNYEEPTREAQQENLRNQNSRILRGGSWNSSQVNPRAVFRYYSNPDNRSFSFGFRLCCLVRPPSS